MKKIILGLMLLTSNVLAGTIEDKKLENKIKEMSVKVVALKTYFVYGQGEVKSYSQGTGVFIGKGVVLTEDHVTDGAESLLVLRHKQTKFLPAVMISSDSVKDLSILSVDTNNITWVTMNPSFRIGQKVIAVGNAGVNDFETARAIITGIGIVRWDKVGRQAIQMNNTKIRPGFSGGGVFNLKGELVGMTEALGIEGAPLAIKASEIMEWLKNNSRVEVKQ